MIMSSHPGNELSGIIIGAAIDVHRELGPGLFESAYEMCLCYELKERNVKVERQVQLPLIYKGIRLDAGYVIDLLVENEIIVELKVDKRIEDVHRAQLLTYMKLKKCKLGLLINFNVPVLKDGIVRMAL